jgi:lipid-A-disaccharide synthase-like uncharacterized protein
MIKVRYFVNCFFKEFGFNSGFSEFKASMFRKEYLLVSIPFATIFSALVSNVEYLIGLQGLTILAIFLVLATELVTGIMASIETKVPISSKRFSRFGLKAFTWFLFLFVVNAFSLQYEGKNYLIHGFWSSIHSLVASYMAVEYFISIDENMVKITGKSTGIVRLIKDKLKDLLKTKSNDKE